LSKYAVVGHHYWNRPGGSQFVCAAATYALQTIGYTPILTSVGPIDSGNYYDWFGIDLSKYTSISLTSLKLRAFGIYLRLLIWRAIKKAIDKYSAQLIFTDECTYKPLIEYIKNREIMLVEYIHFPMEIYIDKRFKGTGLYYNEDPYITERYSKFPMNIYWQIYVKSLPRYMRENPFEISSLVLANSKWTAELVKQIHGEPPEILNPPIPPNIEVVNKTKDWISRNNSVVMLGRFSEEKRYHWVIDRVLPKLKKEIDDVKLYILGDAKTKTSLNYLNRIEYLAKKNNFKTSRSLNLEANVYLIANASRSTIKNIMDSSKIFLHATINEHWGIAVTEAMARGLPTVVHKSGGLWSDLIEYGTHGLGYSDPEEAVKAVTKLLTDEKTWNYYSSKSIEKARSLTIEEFVAKLAVLMSTKMH